MTEKYKFTSRYTPIYSAGSTFKIFTLWMSHHNRSLNASSLLVVHNTLHKFYYVPFSHTYKTDRSNKCVPIKCFRTRCWPVEMSKQFNFIRKEYVGHEMRIYKERQWKKDIGECMVYASSIRHRWFLNGFVSSSMFFFSLHSKHFWINLNTKSNHNSIGTGCLNRFNKGSHFTEIYGYTKLIIYFHYGVWLVIWTTMPQSQLNPKWKTKNCCGSPLQMKPIFIAQ